MEFNAGGACSLGDGEEGPRDRVGEGYFQILKRRKTEDLQEICNSPGAGDLIIFVV